VDDPPEEVLAEHGVTRVIRIGPTVRRPVRPFTATVQAFLRHLHAAGISFVPEPLGYDELGREMLSYVDGVVPVDPLPDWAVSDSALTGLASLIRRLHDAAEGWAPPADAVWGGIPGQGNVSVPALFDVPELVAHQDYCPGNVVFRDGVPAALIDFDLARPTTRVTDCVNALYWWAPLLDPRDRPAAVREADVALRCRLFADAYRMSRDQRAKVPTVAAQRARNSMVAMRAAAEVDPVFRRWWDDGLHGKLQRASRWLDRNVDAIAAALLAPEPAALRDR
jgi:hypothetical protein